VSAWWSPEREEARSLQIAYEQAFDEWADRLNSEPSLRRRRKPMDSIHDHLSYAIAEIDAAIGAHERLRQTLVEAKEAAEELGLTGEPDRFEVLAEEAMPSAASRPPAPPPADHDADIAGASSSRTTVDREASFEVAAKHEAVANGTSITDLSEKQREILAWIIGNVDEGETIVAMQLVRDRNAPFPYATVRPALQELATAGFLVHDETVKLPGSPAVYRRAGGIPTGMQRGSTLPWVDAGPPPPAETEGPIHGVVLP
jgi:hypothetical protein